MNSIPEVTPFFTFTMNLVYPFLVGALLIYYRNSNDKNNKLATRREDARLKNKQDTEEKNNDLYNKLKNLEIRDNNKITRAEANEIFVTIKMFSLYADTVNARLDRSEDLMKSEFSETRQDLRDILNHVRKD